VCGIIGIIGHKAGSLRNLSMRSSASSTAVTIRPASPRSSKGVLTRRRAEGKLNNLELKLAREPLSGTIGIGHTRWATHGRPTENSAHPHATDRLAVVHNGIIENFRELRREPNNASYCGPARLCCPGTTHCLSYCRHHGHGC
jgi:glutamine---fructose-6-phosphate transaminase (isomerizing)